jgi:hypothetical protein
MLQIRHKSPSCELHYDHKKKQPSLVYSGTGITIYLFPLLKLYLTFLNQRIFVSCAGHKAFKLSVVLLLSRLLDHKCCQPIAIYWEPLYPPSESTPQIHLQYWTDIVPSYSCSVFFHSSETTHMKRREGGIHHTCMNVWNGPYLL